MQSIILNKVTNQKLFIQPQTIINLYNKCQYHQNNKQNLSIIRNNQSKNLIFSSSSLLSTSQNNTNNINGLKNFINSIKQINSINNYTTITENDRKEKKIEEEEEEEEEVEEEEIKNIKDMKIKITDSAAQRLNEINKRDNSDKQALRIIVESGGCHGFQYLLDLTETIDPDDDIIFEKDGAKVVVDTMSLPYIDGATLNFKDDLMGSAFEIVDNPNATEGCGCGNSFSI